MYTVTSLGGFRDPCLSHINIENARGIISFYSYSHYHEGFRWKEGERPSFDGGKEPTCISDICESAVEVTAVGMGVFLLSRIS